MSTINLDNPVGVQDGKRIFLDEKGHAVFVESAHNTPPDKKRSEKRFIVYAVIALLVLIFLVVAKVQNREFQRGSITTTTASVTEIWDTLDAWEIVE
jgi:hypothetical protein